MKKKVYDMLSNYVRQHKLLNAQLILLKKRKEYDYLDDVAGHNPFSMCLKSFGPDNRDKNIYFITMGMKTNGMFAHLRTLYKYLAFADRFGFIPVVLWTKDVPYSEEHPINGTTNPFEYYFCQPSEITIDDVRHSYNVFCSCRSNADLTYLNDEYPGKEGEYNLSEEMIAKFSEISAKYLRLNPVVSKIIQNSIDEVICEKRTLAIHYRGTDYKSNFNHHPICLEPSDYFEVIDNLLEKELYDQIFLATDDVVALNQFVDKYGGKIVYYTDTMRASASTSVIFQDIETENSHYRAGLEVLRDVYTLAHCDSLIAGVSQVSIGARILKKAKGEQYQQVVIIDKGINKNDRVFSI